MYERVVIKIGSGVVTKDDGLDKDALKVIIEQIVALRAKGVEVVVVTSGAVATGKSMIALGEDMPLIVRKQVFAAVGQARLMAHYSDMLGRHGHACAQVLVTKEDFRDKQHYFNMKNCLENLIRGGVIPVINENDVIAVTELLFTDNDELAGLVASQLDADAVLLLTCVDGVLDGKPGSPEAKVIPEVEYSRIIYFEKFITSDISKSGRGGMHTKFGIAKKLAAQGIAMHIANGKKRGVIVGIVDGNRIGTRFFPGRKISPRKRRLAYCDGLSRGSVRVDDRASRILRSVSATSLLPVGIVRVEGSFAKGDVIEVRDKAGARIGFGIARYDSRKAKENRGRKNMPPLIHCDHLFIG